MTKMNKSKLKASYQYRVIVDYGKPYDKVFDSRKDAEKFEEDVYTHLDVDDQEAFRSEVIKEEKK